jgi:hypothetical protein
LVDFFSILESLWCWIQSTPPDDIYWQFLCFYVFVFVVTIAVCVLWIKVLTTVVAMQKSSSTTGKLPSYLFRHVLGVILFDMIFVLMAVKQPHSFSFFFVNLTHYCFL